MTAPTQPPDPRVQRIADALDVWSDTVGYESHRRLARVLVEELGGREERKQRTFDEMPPDWKDVVRALDEGMPTWKEQGTAGNAIRAQQRENVETIKALEGRVETAEAANTELDNARKSAEQSARDLRENNATLRAELDAIKGAQVPYRWTVVVKDRMSFTFTSLGSAQTWANGEGGEVIPLYRHHAPALPVVGACVVDPYENITKSWIAHPDGYTQQQTEALAQRDLGGTAHQLLLGAPLPTEGGK